MGGGCVRPPRPGRRPRQGATRPRAGPGAAESSTMRQARTFWLAPAAVWADPTEGPCALRTRPRTNFHNGSHGSVRTSSPIATRHTERKPSPVKATRARPPAYRPTPRNAGLRAAGTSHRTPNTPSSNRKATAVARRARTLGPGARRRPNWAVISYDDPRGRSHGGEGGGENPRRQVAPAPNVDRAAAPSKCRQTYGGQRRARTHTKAGERLAAVAARDEARRAPKAARRCARAASAAGGAATCARCHAHRTPVAAACPPRRSRDAVQSVPRPALTALVSARRRAHAEHRAKRLGEAAHPPRAAAPSTCR